MSQPFLYNVKDCNFCLSEAFNFEEKYKQTSAMIPYLILADMKDITPTCAAVSRRYFLSDTCVHSVVMTCWIIFVLFLLFPFSLLRRKYKAVLETEEFSTSEAPVLERESSSCRISCVCGDKEESLQPRIFDSELWAE